MKKILLLIICFLTINTIFAQKGADNDSITSGWVTTGKFTFLINQSAFSNWQPGGDNSFAGNAGINYDFNYDKDIWSWDNKLIASFGLTNNDDDGVRKSDDRMEFNSVLGKKMKRKNWNFSFFMNFKTQFIDGYDYEDDYTDKYPDRSNEDFPTSGLIKPAYWSFGPGFLWKKSNNLNVNMAPITSKFTFLTSEIFEYNEDLVEYESSNDIEMYGVSPGESQLYELGLNIRAYYKFDVMENINIENILSFYSNYLNKPQNIDIDYTVNLVMKINNVFSTNLTFQAVYDDNAYQGIQMREVFGLGLNYHF